MNAPASDSLYEVGSDESLASIAKEHGYLWKTIWEHSNNAALRKQRKSPNMLVEGDQLFLPDKGDKSVAKATDTRHRFIRKGEPTRLKLQLLNMDEPRKNEPYTLTFGDQVIHSNTDGEGKIDQPIPGQTKSATLMLNQGKEVYQVAIGELDPLDQPRGVQQRLSNLGYDCGGEQDEIGDATREALRRFQCENQLKVSGDVDDATRAKLNQLHV
ncbi:peptidoglycan-binding domain-containing protein [Dyella silvatica]|uniref:peptidoglycan-binding domain-containing protein n=1 Tax=Dyella silvatica TaxID=2992128 RepID=UPI0022521C2B|nr:peptidoglycan-binding domain-containing protein [Dyella silvatica]